MLLNRRRGAAAHAPAAQDQASKTRPQPAGNRRGALAQAAAALLWIAQAALLALAVGRLADGAGLDAVTVPAPGFLLLGVARASLDAWGARRVFTAARTWLSDLRAGAADALARRSPLDRARPASGQAASILAEQAEAVLPWLLRYQGARWRVMLVPPVIALVVGYFSWAAALILVLAAPLIPLFMAVIGWRAKAASEAQLQLVGGMNGFLLDRLRGLSTLRALGAVDATARRLHDTAQALRQGTMRVLRIAFLSSTALELFSALAVALVAVYVGFHLLGQIDGGSWGVRLSLEQGMFILMLAPAFFEPLRDLAAAWHDKAAGEAAFEALSRLQDAAPSLPGALNGTQEAASGIAAPGLAIAGLRFAHPGEAPLFDGFTLDVAPGEHIALVGASGSGKSTLLSLVAGLAQAQGGSIRIGGASLDDNSAAGLRTRMAWVGQKPHVFAGTVRGNVALGRPGVTPLAVTAAVRRAGLADVEHAAPHEALGEGGTGLSGGELVRLALARAAVAPQASLLLADEPTAHLDRETAAGVVDALLDLARGRTLVVATHDLALAARIGRIVQIGQHGVAKEAA
ncbi:thiol reductant ABC exporter subunit CydD [Massilia sp. YIM B02769]|uniref:thiol reductant ABC exporter subunit CydD n=1 Tax=unclassified Massilia TaxID=2609279 RepID=UPI0025B6875A|nr:MULTISPECIES: thiol reductant ABC exporter subunit CydD [unclassified Massilia]MDN4060656.1 thiol reductant ABC exporter subunit CydD [Massilia sp. YIM B02769]